MVSGPGPERRVAHAVRLGAGEGRLRVAGADGDVVAEAREASSESAADHAGAEDGNLHENSWCENLGVDRFV